MASSSKRDFGIRLSFANSLNGETNSFANEETNFLREHQDDEVLISEVIDLVDVRGCILDYQAEVDFLLGLQMGLELGQVDLLRGID